MVGIGPSNSKDGGVHGSVHLVGDFLPRLGVKLDSTDLSSVPGHQKNRDPRLDGQESAFLSDDVVELEVGCLELEDPRRLVVQGNVCEIGSVYHVRLESVGACLMVGTLSKKLSELMFIGTSVLGVFSDDNLLSTDSWNRGFIVIGSVVLFDHLLFEDPSVVNFPPSIQGLIGTDDMHIWENCFLCSSADDDDDVIFADSLIFPGVGREAVSDLIVID